MSSDNIPRSAVTNITELELNPDRWLEGFIDKDNIPRTVHYNKNANKFYYKQQLPVYKQLRDPKIPGAFVTLLVPPERNATWWQVEVDRWELEKQFPDMHKEEVKEKLVRARDRDAPIIAQVRQVTVSEQDRQKNIKQKSAKKELPKTNLLKNPMGNTGLPSHVDPSTLYGKERMSAFKLPAPGYDEESLNRWRRQQEEQRTKKW